MSMFKEINEDVNKDPIVEGDDVIVGGVPSLLEVLSEGKTSNVSKVIEQGRKFAEGEIRDSLNKMFAGKTVKLHVLGGKPKGWHDKVVTVKKVTFNIYDVNGPVYVTTDGEQLHSNPDHDVKVVKKTSVKESKKITVTRLDDKD